MSIIFQLVNDWSLNQRKREWKVLKRKRMLLNGSIFWLIDVKFTFDYFFVMENWKKKDDDVIDFDFEKKTTRTISTEKKKTKTIAKNETTIQKTTTTQRTSTTQKTTTTQKSFTKKIRTIFNAWKKTAKKISNIFWRQW